MPDHLPFQDELPVRVLLVRHQGTRSVICRRDTSQGLLAETLHNRECRTCTVADFFQLGQCHPLCFRDFPL